MNDADNFQDGYHNFMINNYEKCISFVNRISERSTQLFRKGQILKYLSFIGQNKEENVILEISKIQGTDLCFDIILKIATFKKSKKTESIDISSFECDEDSFLYILGGIYYSLVGDQKTSLKILSMSDDLFCDFLRNQIYLRINRVDLCNSTVNHMLAKDEDALETLLSQAYLGIFEQKFDSIKKSLGIFLEIQEKYGQNSFTSNCISVAMILLNNLRDAKSELNEASSINSEDQNTLINMNCLSERMKTTFSNPLMHIKKLPIDNPFSMNIAAKEKEFDCCGATYTLSA